MQVNEEKGAAEFFADAFGPTKLNGLRLKNHFIKAPTFGGLFADAKLSESFVEHHLAVARGGVGMTVVANCAVSREGQGDERQLILDERFAPQLEALVAQIHAQGCAVCLQLNHCGAYKRSGAQALGASKFFNWRVGKWVRAMNEGDIERTIRDYGAAARRARELGVDAIEIQASHGFLISQFLSPLSNRRTDRWGGAVESRAIFAVEVLKAVREAMGPDAPVFAQINLTDAHPKGLNLDEALVFAQILETEGIDALALSSGFTPTDNYHDIRGELPLKAIIEGKAHFWERWYLRLMGKRAIHHYPFSENFMLSQAMRIRSRLSLPMILTGGVNSKAAISQAMKSGFDFVALARPLICQPNFVQLLESGSLERSPCNHCNLCVAYASKGIKCYLWLG